MIEKSSNLTTLIKQTVNKLDCNDGKDGLIGANEWKKFVKGKGETSIKNCITIFNAEKKVREYLTKNTKSVNEQSDLAERWYNKLMEENPEVNNTKTANKTDSVKQTETDKTSASKTSKSKSATKDAIVTNMYKKWSSKFKNSPFDKSFYSKLYDTLKVIKCEIKDSDFDRKIYSSKEEQTMDQVIAIFAGESKLNPKAKNGPFRGIFQLATPGLTDLKKWAKKHPEVKGMNNINQSISLNGFANLSGNQQLDYLVAYTGQARDYSKISQDESITPAQLWAMIKGPFNGKKRAAINEKIQHIDNVFRRSSVEKG